MSDDRRRVSILERIGLGMLLVVVAISFTFGTIRNRMIAFFKK